jgi:hypothetical protein
VGKDGFVAPERGEVMPSAYLESALHRWNVIAGSEAAATWLGSLLLGLMWSRDGMFRLRD